jgi:hypothetical protein
MVHMHSIKVAAEGLSAWEGLDRCIRQTTASAITPPVIEDLYIAASQRVLL